MIVGIDEVGRGCWAGPLVVSAVVLGNTTIAGLTDSKKLTPRQRETLALKIRQTGADIGIGWISNRLVDTKGLTWALKQASRLALRQITAPYDEIIIDGIVKFIDDPRVTTMKKADLLVPSVSAASIIAKVARDRYMYRMHHVFPDYGFHTHVGYGTVGHQAAIRKFGVTPLHRVSWMPLAEYEMPPEGAIETTTGRQAEQEAGRFLEAKGFTIIERNWRTKWCEIDIVAEKDGVIHFVEVKYRKTNHTGDGLAAITPRKVKQMEFAATLWLRRHGQAASRLSAISLAGLPIAVDEWLPDINVSL